MLNSDNTVDATVQPFVVVNDHVAPSDKSISDSVVELVTFSIKENITTLDVAQDVGTSSVQPNPNATTITESFGDSCDFEAATEDELQDKEKNDIPADAIEDSKTEESIEKVVSLGDKDTESEKIVDEEQEMIDLDESSGLPWFAFSGPMQDVLIDAESRYLMLWRISYAWELVEEMSDSGQPPNVFTYNSFLHSLCKKQHLNKPIALVMKIKDQGIVPNLYTYNILIDGLCKGGRLIKDAQQVFHDLLSKEYNINVVTYTTIISGLCKEGLFEETFVLLSEMEVKGCFPNAFTFEIIISALFERGENDKAEKLLREMIARGLL
ncbi:unnamed protein product [Trifolium pratense]|uniref:Uncharacterized protein n=1 Tax=Trifolium pratense TaxID=57577 RepID=A0ACB0LF48_TRIPR|nr:unnamed protein product [Trifolium pratense]